MRHLQESEFIDLAEGRLDPARARHADGCERCRAEAAALRETLAGLAADAVPEPSPLFWDHLSARIGSALDAEPMPVPSWTEWLRGPRAAAAAVALLLVATLAGYAGWTWRSATIDTPAPAAPDMAAAAVDVVEDDLSADAWDVIAAAADALDLEEVESVAISPRPGSAERVAMDLTAEERSELMRLIEEEMRNGS